MNCKKTGCMYFDKTMTDYCARFEPPRVDGCTFRLGLREQNEQLRTALDKINAIRNSIVGTQTVNFSAHVYPLVAALNEAGFEGQGYEEARKEAVTLIGQRDKAEKENSEMKELLRDIYRVCGASSRASHREQTAIFQRLREALGVSV